MTLEIPLINSEINWTLTWSAKLATTVANQVPQFSITDTFNFVYP